MATFPSQLINREEVAEGTMAFTFALPDGFSFKPGQHISVKLINPPETDEEGNKRTFSLTNAPDDDHLSIATRLRDTAFKRVLKTMPLGTPVKIIDPRGSMILHSNADRPAVFLAGGIGITPFMSMIKFATREKLPHKIFLFYSNRNPESAPFLQELMELEKQNPNFKFIATMTNMDESNQEWSGKTGYIDEAMIKAELEEGASPIFYMAGPPTMVSAMSTLLEKMNISPDDIRSEEFSGYGN